MILRRSRFVHILPLGSGGTLVLHALTQLRLGIDAETARLIDWFEAPRDLPGDLPELCALMGHDAPTLAGCVASLIERDVLTAKSAEAELAEAGQGLRETGGHDPGEALERYRRQHRQGVDPYWSVTAPQSLADLGGARRRLDILLFGDCDVQTEAEFLRREGAARGLDLRIAATFPDDTRFAGERRHDAVILGALRARHALAERTGAAHDPVAAFVAEARRLIAALRAETHAPILVDALPEPTVLPLGSADQGYDGHRNRFRRANLALAELAETLPDVLVVDVAAALAQSGSASLVDDGLTSFTHLGSPGWMLERPASELAAVHGLRPDMAPLRAWVAEDPYGRERVVARAHMDALVAALGIEAKKCVIVDLDGVLWPGVLAETGAPFAWSPEISGPHSYVGLYFGLHEALKTLKRRGILLAAVSKNDESSVRELWRYPAHYPHDRLLTPDDFVTWRVNWRDKSDNIRAIAEELGFATEAFVFIDDHPIERERVRQRLPEVVVWGENAFDLRRTLLADPRLQPARISRESEGRTALVRAQLGRATLQASAPSEAEFLASLDLHCVFGPPRTPDDLGRIQELFGRTTQFNTTGRKFTIAELADLLERESAAVFTARVSDRFGDHGLVGAAVVIDREIAGFAMSCRVMGLGVEQRFMAAMLDALSASHSEVTGRIVETARNAPVRHLYADAGFLRGEDGIWRRRLEDMAATVRTAAA